MRFFSIVFFTATALCFAQDVVVKGNSTQYDVFSSTNTSSSEQDRIGAHGISNPTPYWGIGLQGDGGYVGVQGFANSAGVGERFGGYFEASGGSTNYAVYGTAFCDSGANWAGYFSGNVFVSGTLTQSSDLALKKNVMDIASPLVKLGKLKPKSYELKPGEAIDLRLPTGKKYGFLAQDLEAVYPELVQDVRVVTPSSRKGSTSKSYKAVDYIGLIPVLVSSIQAQQAQIDSLKLIVQALRK